ncbi:MAG: conjugal transfer protein TraG N-terminal domain-containing protein [Methanobacterium sp.]|nr:conjugal transfer protein TraG N-terminal domain-containing protein [Methanobacterium sp.]
MGGGEIIYEVLNAVALLLNGGSGTLRALITIGTVSGLFLVYYMFVLGNIEYIAKKWAIPLTLMLSFFFVPQTTVWVHDEVSQFHKKLDHVPLGLAQFAGQISKVCKAITAGVEQAFTLEDDLKYHKSGIVFGSDIMERANEFKIVNQNFRENMKNFIGQCVKYDIMLNNKYTFDQLRDSPNLWELVESSPSKIRGIYWIPIKGGKAEYVTCAGAVEKFNQEWNNELNREAFLV